MTSHRIWLRLLPAALLGLLVGVTAFDQARAAVWEGIGGWDGDTHQQGYGFITIGPLVPVGHGLAVPIRVSASFLYYQFDSSGTSISVSSPGVSLLSGLRVGGHRATSDLLVGVELRRDHRTLNVAGSEATDETNAGVELMADADLDLATRWTSYLLLDYAGAARYWYGLGELRFQLTNLEWSRPNVWLVGAEAVREGNDESDALGAGGFLERAWVHSSLSIGLHAGYKDSGSPGEPRLTGGYLGVGVYQRF